MKTFESKIPEFMKMLEVAPEKAFRKIGTMVVAEVRKVTPKRTGHLKRSLRYFYSNSEKKLKIGSTKFYGIFVERGTKERKKRGKTTANPFMTKTVETLAPEIQKLIKVSYAAVLYEFGGN